MRSALDPDTPRRRKAPPQRRRRVRRSPRLARRRNCKKRHKEEQRLRNQFAAADKAYHEARDTYRDANIHLKQANSSIWGELAGDAPLFTRNCRSRFEEKSARRLWPIGGRRLIRPLTTSMPCGLKRGDWKQHGCRGNKPRRYKLAGKGKRTMAKERSTMLGDVPSNRQGLRREHQDLEAQEKALFKSVDAGREQKREVECEVERLTRKREHTHNAVKETDGKIKEQELIRDNARRGIASQKKLLPASWHTQGGDDRYARAAHFEDGAKRPREEGDRPEHRELDLARHEAQVLHQDLIQAQSAEREVSSGSPQEQLRRSPVSWAKPGTSINLATRS